MITGKDDNNYLHWPDKRLYGLSPDRLIFRGIYGDFNRITGEVYKQLILDLDFLTDRRELHNL